MKFTVNGTEYASWDDVPEDMRRILASSGALPDSDHDGVPDVASADDASVADLPPAKIVTRAITSITVDGVTYDSPDQVPVHLRDRLQAAGLLDPHNLGPDPVILPADSTPADVAPTGQVLLNGVPIEAADKHKRWWRRG